MKRSRILLITALVALLAGGWYVAKRGGETTLIGRLLDVANKGGIIPICKVFATRILKPSVLVSHLKVMTSLKR